VDEAIIGIVGAVVGGAITAAVNSWLAARARVAEELREQRLDPYREIWVQTALFSRWPWTDATYGHVRSFHVDLRQWYYADGGMLLSENARARYGHVQEVAEALVELDRPDDEVLDPEHYRPLMQAASALRTALTEDLESRQQRSVLLAVELAWRHARQRFKAWRRLRKLRGGKDPAHAFRFRLAP
jgi:hypothetical protein